MRYFLPVILFVICFNPSVSYAQGFILDEENFFNDSVEVLIPTNFTMASDELILSRYGNGENVPKIIYTDKETETALLSLNITDNTRNGDTIVKLYKIIKDDIRTTQPEHRFLKTDVIRNRRLANIEVILPNSDGEMLYNMMAFMYVGNNFFSFNFSCPEEDIEKWQNVAQEIAQNIKVANK